MVNLSAQGYTLGVLSRSTTLSTQISAASEVLSLGISILRVLWRSVLIGLGVD